MRCHTLHVSVTLRCYVITLRYARTVWSCAALLLLRCELSSAPGNAQLNHGTEGSSDKQLRHRSRRHTKSTRAEAAAVHTRREVALYVRVWVQLLCRYVKKCVQWFKKALTTFLAKAVQKWFAFGSFCVCSSSGSVRFGLVQALELISWNLLY